MNLFYEIMEVIFTLMDNVYIMLLTTLLLAYKDDIRYKKLKIGIFYIVLNLLTFSIEIFPKQEGVITIAGVAVLILYSMLCLKGQLYLRIIYPILAFLTIAIGASVVYVFFTNITGIPIELVNCAGSLERIMCVLIAKLIIYIVGFFIYIKLKNKMIKLSRAESKVIIMMIITMAINIMGCAIGLIKNSLRQNHVFMLIIILLNITLAVMVYYLVMRISTYNKQLLEESMIRLQLEEKSKNILDIEKYYKDLKILEHDVKHHYTIINTMLLDNNIDEAKKYMKNLMEKNIAVTNLPIVVNSSMINAILSSKFSECKDKDIECKARVTGDISKDMEMDICIILANIIDNAIKASEKEDEPYIGLEMYREKNYLNIIVENKISESVLHANPKLITSKKDKKKHGLGLLSVKNTVERYGGMLDCYEKDNKFVVKVVLKVD